jgi:hypothetical protein
VPKLTVPRRSTWHEWINSIGIIITFCIVAFSTFVNLVYKSEGVSWMISPNLTCRAKYYHIIDLNKGILELCWNIMVSNTSENKMSILSSKIFKSDDRGNFDEKEGLDEVEELDEEFVHYPITLEGGTAHQFLVRYQSWLPASVDSVLHQLKDIDYLSLREVHLAVAEHNIDILGNAIQVGRNTKTDQIVGWVLPEHFKSASAMWVLYTGRGRKFQIPLHWPPSGLEVTVHYPPSLPPAPPPPPPSPWSPPEPPR